MKRICFLILLSLAVGNTHAQLQKVYDEKRDPIAQIDSAVNVAKKEGKHVMCQVGGNWCRWCLMFADFVEKNDTVGKMMRDNYVYTHVNYTNLKNRNSQRVAERLNNPGRFGFPVFVILDGEGNILHTQDSGFLEEGEGYSEKSVLQFLKNWTKKATAKLSFSPQ